MFASLHERAVKIYIWGLIEIAMYIGIVNYDKKYTKFDKNKNNKNLSKI